MEITLPYNYTPRDYQIPLLRAIDNGFKHIFVLMHRRAGKDITLWNAFIKRAVQYKGLHYYLLPTYAQAKKVIWDGMTNDGIRFLDYIPEALVKSKNAQELKIELANGSILQLIGTDKYDGVRGTNPITLVYSEYAYHNPAARDVLNPIIRANGGIEIFNTTPNGHNHAESLWKLAKNNDQWFTLNQTADDTGVFSQEGLEEIKKDYIAQGKGLDMFMQEYYNSFDAAILGAFYAKEIEDLNSSDRICNNVYDPNLGVYTAWDIGWSDDTAIIFYQLFGKEIRIIDAISDNGRTVGDYITELQQKPYKYLKHYFPWDARIKPMSSGKSTIDVAKECGLDNIEISANISVQEGIQQARSILPRCYFDKDKTENLRNALSNYHREYDEKKKTFNPNPCHDWSSHYADCFRYVALSVKDNQPVVNYDAEINKLIGKTDYGLGVKATEYQQYKADYLNELYNLID